MSATPVRLEVVRVREGIVITIGDGRTGFRITGPKMYGQPAELILGVDMDERARREVRFYLDAADAADAAPVASPAPSNVTEET